MNNKVEYKPRTFWQKAKDDGAIGYFVFLGAAGIFLIFTVSLTIVNIRERTSDITGLLLGAGAMAELFCLMFLIHLFAKECERIDEMN